MITHLIFDLNETLYLPETGLLKYIDRRIDRFLQEKLDLDRQKVTGLPVIHRLPAVWRKITGKRMREGGL